MTGKQATKVQKSKKKKKKNQFDSSSDEDDAREEPKKPANTKSTNSAPVKSESEDEDLDDL